ncbi:MAG: tetratricopeptide repeat protein [Dehalococcoidia bacterium]
MEEKSQGNLPGDVLVLRQIGENEWSFEFPRLTPEVHEEFHKAVDLWQEEYLSQAEEQYHQLLSSYPEFIDAYHQLAILLEETNRTRQALQTWNEAVGLGFSCFPKDFSIGEDLLPWGFLDNRPFLRAYEGLGLTLMENGETESAFTSFMNLLALNPNDNQGVRAIAIDCCFRLGRPWEVLGIAERFPLDITPEVLYGRVLALYQMGLEEEAETALKGAMHCLPLVGRELAKKRHNQPDNLYSNMVTVGGADEAYWYWNDQGHHWKNTPGALDFVRAGVEKADQ